MKIKAILTMLIMLGGACMSALPVTAEAARLGGGRSFGSRPSMSQPAQAPSAMQRQSTQQRQQAAPAGGVYVLELPGLPGILYGLDIEQHSPSSLLRCSCVRTAVCLRPAPSLCNPRSRANTDNEIEKKRKNLSSYGKRTPGRPFRVRLFIHIQKAMPATP